MTPVTCESWPSTSATYSCSSRSESLCLAACGMTLPIEEGGQTAHAVLEGDRRHEPEAVAHRRVDGMKPDVLLGLALVANRHVDAEQPRHRAHDDVAADWRARCEVDRDARAVRLHE